MADIYNSDYDSLTPEQKKEFLERYTRAMAELVRQEEDELDAAIYTLERLAKKRKNEEE